MGNPKTSRRKLLPISSAYLGLNALLATAYFILAKFGLYLASLQSNSSPVWPASGFAVFALAVFGARFFPGIFLGAFLANLLAPTPWLASAGIATGNTLEALLGAAILNFLVSSDFQLRGHRYAIGFIAGAVMAPVLSAGIGVATLLATGGVPGGMWFGVFHTWYIGDALGILLVAPALHAVWTEGPRKIRLAGRGLLYRAAGLGLAILACGALFVYSSHESSLILIFPVLLLVVRYLSGFELKLFGLVFAFAAVVLTYQGIGPYQGGSLNDNLVSLQLFLANIALTSLALAGLSAWNKKLIPYRAFLASWALMFLVSWAFQRADARRADEKFAALVESVESSLQKHLQSYEAALLAGAGLFDASEEVNRIEWAKLSEAIQVHRRVPGIHGIGFIRPVSAREETPFVASMRANGIPDFHIHDVPHDKALAGTGSAKDKYVIKYFEPMTAMNRQALGLNIASERNRQTAADLARDSGHAVLTERIFLVQEKQRAAASLLLMPVYEGGGVPDSPEKRRDLLKGWIYAPISTESLFHDAVKSYADEIHAVVFDGDDPRPGKEIFRLGATSGQKSRGRVSRLSFAQHTFSIEWNRAPHFVSGQGTMASWVNAFGSLLGIMLGVLIFSLKTTEQRATQIAEQRSRALVDSQETVSRLNRDLEQNLAWQNAIVNGSQLAIISSDTAGLIRSFNPAAENLLGYAAHEVIDKQTPALWHMPEEVVLRAKALSVELRHPIEPGFAAFVTKSDLGITETTEWTVKTKMGQLVPVRLTVHSIKDKAGTTVGYVGVLEDITLQKNHESSILYALKRAESAREAKSAFLANMSHEIRTPINGIIGMTNLLLGEVLAATQREFAENISRCAKSLLVIINDILDFSKIEAGKMEMEVSDFQVAKFLEESITPFKYQAEERGIRLHVRMASLSHLMYRGDYGRIRQVLTNLLSNALKFTKQGEVQVNLEALEEGDSSTLFRFEVRDSGVGINESAIKRLFQAFSQADASVTRRFGGTGLGLSISKRLVELMGGKIGVQSEEGRGSTFWFSLRLEKSNAKENVEICPLPELARGQRVLVAEDNYMNQQVALKHLEKLGYKAHAVGNGFEAIDALREMPFDLVLMDCQMPELDGYETTRRIRASDTMSFRNIPIVAMTANAVSGDKEECLRAGMNDYISKPFEVLTLAQVIGKWVGQQVPATAVVEEVKDVASTNVTLDDAVVQGLLELEDGKPDFFFDMTKVFLDASLQNFSQLKEWTRAAKEGDIKKLAHQMKSSSGNLGLRKFSKLSAELERNPQAAASLVPQLEAAFAEAQGALERRIRELTGIKVA